MPLILDSLESVAGQSFTTAELQGALVDRHGLAIPQHTVSTLLGRCVKRKVLRREAHRYIASNVGPSSDVDIPAEKLRIQRSQKLLGAALRAHAAGRGHQIETDEEALTLVLELLEKQQVTLLLDGPPSESTHAASRRELAIVAEFVRDAVTNDPDHRATLMAILEGMVLYRAAFLPDLAEAKKQFSNLRVYFDSGIVREALGYEGPGPEELARESLRVLKTSGIQCLVFDNTIQEIRRILTMYERKLATSEGRQSLYPSAMMRHFITKRFTPSDVAQMDALLERSISAVGLQIAPTPQHLPEYTLDEKDLGQRLARPEVEDDETSPRVIHDVDSVAAILTLRRGHRATKLEDAKVLFVSSAALVVKNIKAWFKDQGGTGVEPAVHVRALSNLAWLKRPAMLMDFKMREVVVLCSAALRPSRTTWDRFLKHLDDLRSSAAISSDEAAAIVISELSDRLLGEAEFLDDGPEDGPDAHTMDDVIARVKTAYAADATRKVEQAEAQRDAVVAAAELERDAVQAAAREREEELSRRAGTEAERARQLELRLDQRACAIASGISAAIYWLVAVIVLGGAVALIAGHERHAGWFGVIAGGAVLAFMSFELLGIFQHLKHLRHRVEGGLATRIRRWIAG